MLLIESQHDPLNQHSTNLSSCQFDKLADDTMLIVCVTYRVLIHSVDCERDAVLNILAFMLGFLESRTT